MIAAINQCVFKTLNKTNVSLAIRSLSSLKVKRTFLLFVKIFAKIEIKMENLIRKELLCRIPY